MNLLLNKFIVQEHIKSALKEDIGFGDISTDYIVNENDILTAKLNSRAEGILAGIEVFALVFKTLDENIEVQTFFKDGEKIKKGDTLAIIKGSARAILTGERTALNYIQRMSGIATLTNTYQELIKKYNTRIVDTRKTTPNFRIFEKYSVKIGGVALHRFNLSDCVMLKDNHIKLAGSLTKAIQKIKQHISHAHKIEVECDTIEQVNEALAQNVDIIMLDNMSIDEMEKCVKLINKHAIIEASGCINLSNLQEIAKTGVDIISSSAIVTKAGTLDLGLDI